MPVRRRGSLLAGAVAWAGLCSGLGCQSVPAQSESPAPRPAQESTSHSWFGLRHADPNLKSAQTSAKPPARPKPDAEDPQDAPQRPVSPVSLMRPVAVRGVSAAPGEHGFADPWRPDAPTSPPADPGVVQAGGLSQEYPPLVNTSNAFDPGPNGPEIQPAGSASPGDSDGDKPAVSVAHPIPAGSAPAEKQVAPAVFIGPPKPLAPPHPGAPVPKEFEKRSLSSYVIEPPDILLVQGTPAIGLKSQPLAGPHLVRPDGTIGLGIYGSVFVAGMTIDMAKSAIATALKQRAAKDLTEEQIQLELQVDVIGYNSKFYYIITDGGGYGQQVFRVPCTGNETVLDAISQIGGLPVVSSRKRIWVARATPYEVKHPKILPVDWKAITQYGIAATNYQIFPGDRIFVNSDPLIQTNSFLNKLLSPVERVLGTVLLGATTVTAVKTASHTP